MTDHTHTLTDAERLYLARAVYCVTNHVPPRDESDLSMVRNEIEMAVERILAARGGNTDNTHEHYTHREANECAICSPEGRESWPCDDYQPPLTCYTTPKPKERDECACDHAWDYHGPEVPGCCECRCRRLHRKTNDHGADE